MKNTYNWYKVAKTNSANSSNIKVDLKTTTKEEEKTVPSQCDIDIKNPKKCNCK